MPSRAISADDTPLQSLFDTELDVRLLLSCHLLGKPTAAQLSRLHQNEIAGERSMRRHLSKLTASAEPMLAVIKPLSLENISRRLPYIYLDTTRSRRHLQKTLGIPFRRPPELPSRDWRFLYHDISLVDELIAFELTARTHSLPFGYESHFDVEGKRVYPRISISDGSLQHQLEPRPDKTLIVGQHHLVIEHDCGEETVTLGHIMRDATIARKQLVYDQLERDGALDRLGWNKRLYLYIIDGKKRTKLSSRKRVKRCLDTLPSSVNPHRFFFIDRQTFLEAGDDISELTWMRGDQEAVKLPCFRK